ncbi:MAG: peptidoglycan DD-metalloendopeptidase family protein [Chloroflexi bacterium]|nr:peptidoglycan DD-metalloendopeptidase family protein [Chloroflexota bacterium]
MDPAIGRLNIRDPHAPHRRGQFPPEREEQSSRLKATGQSLTQYRHYALHGLLLALAFAAVVTAVAGGVTDSEPTTVSSIEGPVAEARAGYLKPAALISTVPSLIARHEAEIAATTASPAPEPTAELVAAAAEPLPSFFTYTIQPGDTMGGIATRYGISEAYLRWNNPMVSIDPDLLYIGSTLVVPGVDGIVYNVTLGDTLGDIAAYYDVTVDSIISFEPNDLSSPDSLIDGTVLVIPGGVPPPTIAPVLADDEIDPVAGPVPASGSFDTPAPAPAPAPEPAPAPAPVASVGFIWPYYGPITTYFGEPTGYSYHKGIDLDGFGSWGAPIAAAASGTVVLAAWDSWGLGYHVIVDHGNGFRTTYAHLSDLWVVQGQWVNQGEAVGALGSTGYSTGAHLHFELWAGGVPVNPLAYLP